MDPLTIATAVGGVTTTAYSVGSRIYGLWEDVREASDEYKVFSKEVNQLGTLWSMVKPLLEEPDCALSEEILTPLSRIIRDTKTILFDLQDTVDIFEDESHKKDRIVRHRIFKITTSEEGERRKRFKKFIHRRKIVLQRSQIHYATTIITVVISVVQHAQSRPSAGAASASERDNEAFLIRENRYARRRVQEEEEEEISDWPMRATTWLNPLPQGADGRRSPFDILASQWTTQTRRAHGGDRTGSHHHGSVRNLERIVAELQRSRQEDQEQYQRDRREDQERHQRQRQEDQEQHQRDMAIIERLQIRIDQLTEAYDIQSERYQAAEEARARSEEKNAELEAGNRALRARLAQLQNELDAATRQLRRMTERTMPPSAFNNSHAPNKRHRQSSDSSWSTRTYVDRPDSMESRASRRDSTEGSFRDGRRETIHEGRRREDSVDFDGESVRYSQREYIRDSSRTGRPRAGGHRDYDRDGSRDEITEFDRDASGSRRNKPRDGLMDGLMDGRFSKQAQRGMAEWMVGR